MHVTTADQIISCKKTIDERNVTHDFASIQLEFLYEQIQEECLGNKNITTAKALVSNWLSELQNNYQERIASLYNKLINSLKMEEIMSEMSDVSSEMVKLSLSTLPVKPLLLTDEDMVSMSKTNYKVKLLHAKHQQLNAEFLQLASANTLGWDEINDYSSVEKMLNTSSEIIALEIMINETMKDARTHMRRFKFIRILLKLIKTLIVIINLIVAYLISDKIFIALNVQINSFFNLHLPSAIFSLSAAILCYLTTDKLTEKFKCKVFWKYARIVLIDCESFELKFIDYKRTLGYLILKYAIKSKTS